MAVISLQDSGAVGGPVGRANLAGVGHDLGKGPYAVAGILLSGGQSRRMGFDKALLLVGGVPNAVRLAGALRDVARGPLVEVGQGCSGLPCSREEPGGAGPLAALAAGVSHLWSLGHRGPALVLACDLPFVGAAALRVLAGWPGGASVVPVADGRPQPLCARWSAHDLELAVELVAQGERAMKALLRAATVCLVDEAALVAASPTGTGQLGGVGRLLADVDTPEDLRRFGLTPPARRTPARRRRCGQ